MHFIDDRFRQRSPQFAIAIPVECIVNHHRFRHSPGVIAKIAGQILLLVADDVAKHFVAPFYPARDRLGVGIKKQLGTVEAHSDFRFVRTRNPITINLSRSRFGQENVPDLVRMFRYGNADVFLACFHTVEETEID